MDSIQAKQEVLSLLQRLPICTPNSSKTEWAVRCPYCGDSVKSRDHGHLSILIDMKTDKPMLWKCFRCNASGIVSEKLLNDLGLPVTDEILAGISESHKRSYDSEKYKLLPKKYIIPEDAEDPDAVDKLDYINRRLGLNYGFQSASRDCIITDFKYFLKINHIRYTGRFDLDTLQKNYVGFLSSNRNRINFRRINDSNSLMRYYKITLDPLNQSRNTFYALPASFKLDYTDDIHIHIAEGTFDILAVKYHLPHPESGTHLFYAATGFFYANILKYLIAKGVNTDLILHIYSDADKSNEDHYQYLRTLIPSIWVDTAYIHRNACAGEKDYGVTSDRIIDSAKRVDTAKLQFR